ncbi:Uma2 family endonuclease [Aetokthonos hydrillicola Thurmond2011]|jgi:Uma2 family endonuclease|uniref:Uma2 family endonuclease n=1 Tax=Aetokthonos hydrillicola Thurmond2011 TaxID=2712845 RepID=A0AAP5I970_9CYAN|nr:Uma2 family endonuclease [Aetokthonos hydrillicola]MBO3460765.1 Uma2 family endonuclease [Aetokthonos hydrillicola CCALA 1050]MBW4585362.1 Uma2 family endonuclease [Aetokthonos hydrillicola CCALA 1050]MDR9897293.1 Uma2 family endonuclease [Aetokthonos hydrillicola Thurmond2011]
MSTSIKPKLSLEEFLQQPETKPASEYITGEIIQKPMPQGEHSLLQTTLCEIINGVTKSQKIAMAFPELRCTFGNNSIIPDVAVFGWGRIPLNPSGRIINRFEIHPDWAIEILSPDQRQTKVLENLLHCSRAGTELGWLIDSEEESVLAIFPGQRVEFYRGGAQLPILSGIEMELTAEQVFSWLTLG